MTSLIEEAPPPPPLDYAEEDGSGTYQTGSPTGIHNLDVTVEAASTSSSVKRVRNPPGLYAVLRSCQKKRNSWRSGWRSKAPATTAGNEVKQQSLPDGALSTGRPSHKVRDTEMVKQDQEDTSPPSPRGPSSYDPSPRSEDHHHPYHHHHSESGPAPCAQQGASEPATVVSSEFKLSPSSSISPPLLPATPSEDDTAAASVSSSPTTLDDSRRPSTSASSYYSYSPPRTPPPPGSIGLASALLPVVDSPTAIKIDDDDEEDYYGQFVQLD